MSDKYTLNQESSAKLLTFYHSPMVWSTHLQCINNNLTGILTILTVLTILAKIKFWFFIGRIVNNVIKTTI